MNILVSYMGRHGGGAEYSYEITKGLCNIHKNVYAIISAQADNVELWKQLPLKKLFLVPTSDQYKGFVSGTFKFLFKYLPQIKKELKGISIDILYIPMGHPWTTLTTFFLPYTHCVATLHDPIYHPGTPLPIKISGWIKKLKPEDSIVILTKSFYEYTKKQYKKKDNEVVVIPHGAFSHYDVCKATESAKPLAKFNFLFFGRITPYKGVELLVEAFQKLASERDDVSLRVIGSGDISEYKETLKSCPNCVVDNRYIGDDEVHGFFTMPNTITVIPYTSATQSGVIPIAMREKSLIISTNNEGLIEQTKDGTLALMSDINSDALFLQMKYAVENYEVCQVYVKKAKEYIESLSWDNLAKILIDHCKSMLKQK